MIKDAFHHALGVISIPSGRTLWLYGEPGVAFGDVYHPWQGRAAFSDMDALGQDYDAVFLNCPKQQEESEGLLALALARSKGFVMAGAANDAGGGRLKRMMEAYGLQPHSISKSRSRIVWTTQAQQANPEVIKRDLINLSLRELAMDGENWWTVPGLFGWNKIDPGSRMLLASLPPGLAGRIADFGCGYGYLAAKMAAQYSGIQTIDAYDIDARAVQACKKNAADKVNVHWQDIRTLEPRTHYDAVVMNPPFHSGAQEVAALGQHFIIKAWESLKPRGRLFLVANKHLPYEKTVPGLSVLREGEGYKIITGQKE